MKRDRAERIPDSLARRPFVILATWLAVVALSLVAWLAASGDFSSTVSILTHTESGRGKDLVNAHFSTTNRTAARLICAAGPDGPVPLAWATGPGTNPVSSNVADIASCYELKWGVSGAEVQNRDADSAYRSGAAAAYSATAGMQVTTGPPDLISLLLPTRISGTTTSEAGKLENGTALRATLRRDLAHAELIATPLTLIILMVLGGPSLRAIVPLLVASCCVIVAVGIVSLLAHAWSLSAYTVNMIVMVGLATGIDYSLLVNERVRDECLGTVTVSDAVHTAVATAGRAVLLSGSIVIIAVTAMLLVPISVVRDLALGAILVVAVGLAAVFTLLPSILRLFQTRSKKLPATPTSSSAVGFWRRWSLWIATHPVPCSLIMLTALTLLASQSVRLRVQITPIGDVADGPILSSSTTAYWERESRLTLRSVVEIVVTNDDKEKTSAIDKLISGIGADADFAPVVTTQVSDEGGLMIIRALVVRPANSNTAIAAVSRLRATLVPQALEGTTAVMVVTGPLAQASDLIDIVQRSEARIVFLVLAVSFIALTLVFRSIIMPMLATLLTLLSVAASMGVLVLVVQEGYGAPMIGLQSTGAIEVWVPVALFVIVFGLSMDYHVFLVSRVEEIYRETGKATESIARGVATTGRVICGAALIMAVVFAAFSTGRLVLLQQLGLGLAAAVLIDAFLVRLTLVPAIMTLLGHWNWRTPR